MFKKLITKSLKPLVKLYKFNLKLHRFSTNNFNKKEEGLITDRSDKNNIFDLTKRKVDINEDKLNKITKLTNTEKNSEKLLQKLFTQIKFSGPIALDEYMNICLYDRDYGYYTTKEYIFGEKGDFITSPELSQMFGETISVFLYKILEDSFNFSKTWDLVEIGAGNGYLMADLINSMVDLKQFNGLNVSIIETSDRLIKIQQENINNMLLKKRIYTEYEYNSDTKIDTFIDKKNNFSIKWYNSLEKFIQIRNGIILDNTKKNPLQNIIKFVNAKVDPKLK